MNVPFLDLKAHHAPLMAELHTAIQDVVNHGAFTGGPFVAAFEEDFAAYCGAKYAIGVGNGTDALWLSLLALGVGPDDEVITVPSTFMATAEAITYCGAKPVFVDIDEQTYTMDAARLEAAITPRTKAIIPVHLFGQVADMDAILAVANRHQLPVVEDACQAPGAAYQHHKAGTMGATGCFSFYPSKNLGAWGEAGAILTNDPVLKAKIQMLRDHGQAKKYHHAVVGWNARMDGIQGAVLRIKLKHLDEYNRCRRANADLYRQYLNEVDEVILPIEAVGRKHIYHIYAIRVVERDRVLQELNARGIGCGIHYPIPVHLQEAYRSLGKGQGSFPISESCAGQFLSLPMFPELTGEQIESVVRELKACLRGTLKPNAVIA
jgi:dTDP-4-amino-4,6-dideoxygalactose transaminase